MNEPGVTLTDYALGLECAFFALWLLAYGQMDHPLRLWFIIFFVSIGLAAFTGGTVHGYFANEGADEGTLGRTLLWVTTLIAIGVTALSGWAIGAQLYFSETIAAWVTRGAVIVFGLYCVVVLFARRDFLVAIVHYLPATIFLLVVYVLVYQQAQETAVLSGLLGLILTFIAAGVQQAQLSFHPVYLSHNALYHVLQAVALFLIYWSARWFVIVSRGI